MLEMTCTCVTTETVLQTSGHVAKFADFMVKDVKNGNCYRADKLIGDHVEKLLTTKGGKMKPEEKARLQAIAADCENYSNEELDACIKNEKIRAPVTNNELSEAVPFNLMFSTQIGPTGHLHGYLRPETAQGIFLNFRKLNEFNNGRMPFAGAQIGLGFRNEISPKQGLLRVREFQMAEIEHFVDPNDKSHKKFHMVSDVVLPLWSAKTQDEGSMELLTDIKLGDAVANGTIGNETLAYFMARTFAFLKKCGVREEGIRFRQHRSNEMAHYASDCWDAEVETSYGWIEVAGHSDRSCFDLQRHAEKSKVDLVAARPLKEAKVITVVNVKIEKQKIGKTFKKDAKPVQEYLENMTAEQKEKHHDELQANGKMTFNVNGQDFELTTDFVQMDKAEKEIKEEKYVPHVIEPSYGLGRIMYCVFEHCFKMRENDAQRTYFDFPALVAPVKCSILPLMDQEKFEGKNTALSKYHMNTTILFLTMTFFTILEQLLTQVGISSKIETSGASVGKRYARTDECGIPYCFTVDFDTLEDDTVTMRELDSMKQVRIPMADAPVLMTSLVNGAMSWQSVLEKYPAFNAAAEEK